MPGSTKVTLWNTAKCALQNEQASQFSQPQLHPELFLNLVAFSIQKPSGMQVLSDRSGVSWDCNAVQVMCAIRGLQ